MTKITLTNLVNLQNETTAVNAINSNNAVLVAAVDNTISRNGTAPNQMSADFDMNSNRVLNLPAATTATEPVRLTEFNQAVFGTPISNGITTTNTTNSTSPSTGSINTPGGLGVVKDAWIGGSLHAAVGGDLTGTLPSPTVTTNAVSNSKLAQAPSYTLKGNATGSTANVTDISIPGLTQKVSPVAGDILMIVDSAASNAFKYATLSAIQTVGAVASLNSKTGAINFSTNTQVFSASGTYTPTANMVYCVIECIGGGGGGGGCQAGGGAATGGNGGGAGGYARKTVTAAAVGASKAVTIGAAGAAAVSGPNAGGAGGTTSVGSLCVATGGSGGAGNTFASVANAFAAGGVGTTGDILLSGGVGGVTDFAALAGVGSKGGEGGNSYISQGARSFFASSGVTSNGASGSLGSGGSGGCGSNVSANAPGGVGGSGYVIITEYMIG